MAALLLAPCDLGLAATPSAAKQQIQKLTAVLESQATQKERADACRELARIGDRDVVAALAKLLSDESLSHMARYALETVPDAEVDKVFRAALEQLHGRPLVGVIGSVGVRHDAKAVKSLSRLLRDADPDVAQAAARSLGKIANSAAAKALQAALPAAAPGNQLAFCEGLFRCAEKFEASGHSKQAAAIYDGLRKSSAGHQVRTAALRGALLTRHKEAAALSLLSESLASSEYPVFAAAARTSREMPGVAVTKVLATELPKANAEKQVVLTQVLGTRGDPAALPALESAARNCEAPVRVAAFRAVSQLGNASSVNLLRELMGASDPAVAAAAQEALAGLPGKEADAAVLAMLSGADEGLRNAGLDLAVRRRMTSAIPELYRAASGPDLKFRVAAVKRLGELSDERQVPGLLDLLAKAKTSEDLDAAEHALTSVALGAPEREAVARKVAAAATSAQPTQKIALTHVLGAVGGASSLQFIRTAVTDSNAEVRAAAIRALGSWSTADSAPDLLQLARSAEDPKDKMLSLRGYLGLAGQAEIPAEKRLGMCREAAALVQGPDEKKLLLAALGTIRSTESFALIVPHLSEPATRDEAGVACLSVAGKLLEGDDAAKNAAAAVEALRRVSEAAPDTELAKRAQALAERAQSKAGGK